ncbi:MAG TPA: protein kinase [Pyrinomonadaceae bacterium]|nr:protein kinase [Pyrinomonadaceae bacterium]
MSPELWQKIESVFQSALDISPEKRSEFVAVECGDDSVLKKEVEKLLADYDSAESFIESPVWTDSHFLNSSAKKIISKSLDEESKEFHEHTFIGKKIGSFKITDEIGRGGMGAVFLAERADGEFSQKVAIKLIKRGMDSDFIVRRFRHERQILASFEHPFIARLLDGGTTEDGLPYFVMEYITGETLYNYADKKRLNLTERLKLFQKICSAVSYAHERQIIHRDIKPSNILVTKHNSPKLLDFGIAKVLDPDLIHESINPTASLMRLMTPDYASPEQVRGIEVTPSSDIYSLGILLYELLTGHRPYNFAGRALHEVSQVICEVAPELPSKIIEKNENLLPQYSQSADLFAVCRNSTRTDLAKELTDNLDNIVMKALAKDVSERYLSVQEFSEDISRHLRGQEIQAEIFSPKSDVKKPFNQPQTAKSLAVLPFKFLNLVDTQDTGDKFLGVGLADALITRLSKVRSFVVRPTSSILQFREEMTDPIEAGNNLHVDFLLDGSIKKANNRLRITVQLLNVAENSTIWATSIDETITDVFALEDTIANKVIEVLLPQLTGNEREEFFKRGTDSPEAFEHYLRGRYYFNTFTEEGLAKSFVSFHSAIAADPNYARAYTGLADYYNWLGIIGVLPPQECFLPAIEAATKAVELDNSLSEAHATLGFSLHAGNYDWGKAEHHLKRALELNPNNADAFVWYSIVLYTQGRFSEGLDYARRAIDIDPLTPFNHHNLGWGFYFARRFEEGIKQYKEVIKNFPNYIFGHYGLSKIYRFIGKSKESLDEAIETKKIFNDGIFSLSAEIESLAADGQMSEAKNKLTKLSEIAKTRFVSPYNLALIYCYLKDKDKALEKLEEALSIKEAWLNWAGVEPTFDLIREEDRFHLILETIGYDVFFHNFSASRNNIQEVSPETVGIENGQNTQNLKLPDILDSTTLFLNENKETKEPEKPKRSRKLLYAAIALTTLSILIVAAVYKGILTFEVNRGNRILNSNYQTPTIVVLPFKADNAEQMNLGIGLSDDLTRKLGIIKRLSVIAASSGRIVAEQPIEQIGTSLNAGFVIRGNFTKKGNNATISAEMIDTRRGEPIWKEDFTSADGNLFALQSKLAEKVWQSLGIDPLPVEREQVLKSYTQNPLAYELYLLGSYQMTNRSPEDLKKAVSAFAQSLDADPYFAPAHAGLADAYVLMNLYFIKPPEDSYRKAEEAANKALSIDENSAEAHTSLGYIKFFNNRDRSGAELEFRRAIQINPSYAQAHHWFALALMALNRPLEAVSEAQASERLNPRAPITKTAVCMANYYAKQYEEGLKACDEAIAINDNFVPAYKTKRWIYTALGNYEKAQSAYQKEYTYYGGNNEPGWMPVKIQVEALNGNNQQLIADLDKAVQNEQVKDNPHAYAEEIALAYNLLGDKDKALTWLEKAEVSKNHKFNFIKSEPRFANLQNEPRFQALLRKLENKPN